MEYCVAKLAAAKIWQSDLEMKILIFSSLFAPSIGGMETVMEILAEEFSKAKHEVRVVTSTKKDGSHTKINYKIVRNPGIVALFKLICWSDISIHACVSLKFAVAALFAGNKMLFIHHTWYENIEGMSTWKDHLKKYFCRFATNVSVSQAIADRLPVASQVIHNPYRAGIFAIKPEEATKTYDLIAVARLVSDKGIDQLIKAIASLKGKGVTVSASIVGDGPEKLALENLTRDLEINSNVRFHGLLSADNLARIMRQHRMLVVPSKWREPFGVVVLEAVACGLYVIAADGGGIKEALGSCGLTYPRNDILALTESLYQLLTTQGAMDVSENTRQLHLKQFSPTRAAELYLESIETILTK